MPIDLGVAAALGHMAEQLASTGFYVLLTGFGVWALIALLRWCRRG